MKTATSTRQVPVHRTLMDIGMLGLFTSNNATGRIFGDLHRGGIDRKYSYEYSGDFTVYRRKTKTYEEWKDFHSFRHTFISALWQATRDMVLVGSIVGHGSKSQTADYTHIQLADKAEAVTRLKYDGLDLAHLYK